MRLEVVLGEVVRSTGCGADGGDREHGLDPHVHAVVLPSGGEGLAQLDEGLIFDLWRALGVAAVAPIITIERGRRLLLAIAARRLRLAGGVGEIGRAHVCTPVT